MSSLVLDQLVLTMRCPVSQIRSVSTVFHLTRCRKTPLVIPKTYLKKEKYSIIVYFGCYNNRYVFFKFSGVGLFIIRLFYQLSVYFQEFEYSNCYLTIKIKYGLLLYLGIFFQVHYVPLSFLCFIIKTFRWVTIHICKYV